MLECGGSGLGRPGAQLPPASCNSLASRRFLTSRPCLHSAAEKALGLTRRIPPAPTFWNLGRSSVRPGSRAHPRSPFGKKGRKKGRKNTSIKVFIAQPVTMNHGVINSLLYSCLAPRLGTAIPRPCSAAAPSDAAFASVCALSAFKAPDPRAPARPAFPGRLILTSCDGPTDPLARGRETNGICFDFPEASHSFPHGGFAHQALILSALQFNCDWPRSQRLV